MAAVEDSTRLVESVERAVAELLDQMQRTISASPTVLAEAFKESTERATLVGLAGTTTPEGARHRAVAWMAHEALRFALVLGPDAEDDSD